MDSPLQTPDFFALEAGEALDAMEMLLHADDPPVPADLFRATRLLRGSAILAGQQPLAHAAGGLETFARRYRDRPRSTVWSPAVREQLSGAIEEFRLLLRRVREWGEADTARALRLGRTLELLAGHEGDGVTGGAPGSMPADAPAGGGNSGAGTLTMGVRAFVAREGALVASALDRAARALRVSGTDREPLYTVIRRMQSLRGLAELGELAPLPEILDGIELAVGDLTRMFAPPPGVDEVVQAAAHALTRVARDVAQSGRPDPESAETRRFAESVLRVFAIERDVVPIETLYVDGDPEPLRQAEHAAGFETRSTFGPLELVSHGEHLCRTADLVAGSRSVIRDLRLYQLLGTLRSIGTTGPDPMAVALGVFARAVREALATGAVDDIADLLVTCLRDAGDLLRGVADSDDWMSASRRLLDVAYRLDQAHQPPVHTGKADDEADVVPIAQLLLPEPVADELPVVPIESLAPDDERAAAAPNPLEATFRTYRRLLLDEPGDVLPSLAALLDTARRPAAAPSAKLPTVAIGDLCYRGRAALERAAAVREQLATALATRGPDALATVRPLLDELLDLVPLALTES
jgi:hypothetical protein